MYSQDFPLLSRKIDNKRVIYFDAACTYLNNIYSIKSSQRYDYNFSCCAGDRGASYLGSLLTDEIERIRKMLKNFINASEDDIVVFTSSATEGINILLHSFCIEDIHTCIVSDLEHNSNYLPQCEYSRRNNAKLLVFSYTDFHDTDILEQKISTLSPGFLLSITHSSNIIGGIFDIKKISSIVHKYGGYILVDSTQYIVHNEEFVSSNGIDFLVFSGHKLGGPSGIGVLYIKNNVQKLIHSPGKVGGGTLSSFGKFSEINYKNFPYKLEAGVQNFSGIFGLGGIVTYYNETSYDSINKYILGLTKYFWKEFYSLKLEDFFRIVNSKESLIVTLIPNKFFSIDFQQYCNYFLNDYIISFRTGTMCTDNFTQKYYNGDINFLRISFGIYNSYEDIDIFLGVLKNYISSLK